MKVISRKILEFLDEFPQLEVRLFHKFRINIFGFILFGMILTWNFWAYSEKYYIEIKMSPTKSKKMTLKKSADHQSYFT